MLRCKSRDVVNAKRRCCEGEHVCHIFYGGWGTGSKASKVSVKMSFDRIFFAHHIAEA